jgi:TPR repeat protein
MLFSLKMQKYRISSLLYVLPLVAAAHVTSAHAFDASKVIKGDAASGKIFEFFFKFKKDGKQKEAVEVLRYAAENGNSDAQWKLARIYQTGDGVQQNPLEAFQMFQKIANQSSYAIPNTPVWQYGADAFVALGKYYTNGIPNTLIKADPNKARIMFTTAAMVYRHPEAQFELGRMQINNDKIFGQGRSGIRNLSLAYEKGHVGAEALLGYYIFEGVHTKYNPVRGLVMLGNAKRRASNRDLEWINQIYDEAYSLARPDHRAKAVEKLSNSSKSLD